MKYEESKKLSASQILKYLQNFVKDNAGELRKNNVEANKLMKDKSSSKKMEELDWLNARNKNLVQKNNQYLELHTRLLDFLKSLQSKNLEVNDEIEIQMNDLDQETRLIEYFDLTIQGKLEYNARHPYYRNEEFRNMLMEYYVDMEAYEMCDKIIKEFS